MYRKPDVGEEVVCYNCGQENDHFGSWCPFGQLFISERFGFECVCVCVCVCVCLRRRNQPSTKPPPDPRTQSIRHDRPKLRDAERIARRAPEAPGASAISPSRVLVLNVCPYMSCTVMLKDYTRLVRRWSLLSNEADHKSQDIYMTSLMCSNPSLGELRIGSRKERCNIKTRAET